MNLFTTSGVAADGGVLAITDNPWIVLAIVVISAITSWFQNRNKKSEQAEPWGGEDDADYKPYRKSEGTTTSPTPGQPLNWEEELKRLLEGKPPLDSTAGTPPPPPPPIVRRVPPPPPPLPVSVARESLPTDHEGKPSRESAVTPWQDVSLDTQPKPTKPLATLEHSTHAYQRASQLHETVATHLQRVDEQTEKHGKPLVATVIPRRAAVTADARAVVALLRHPATARQAMLASLVLAPPKGMES